MIPDSAPFNPEQRAWLNGFFAGVFSTATNGSATATTASVVSNGAPCAAAAAPPAEEIFPWHDPALSLEERLTLANGKPVERQLMAAMAQLDCGACGYLCKTYSEAIARGDERDLTRCTPGGSETAKTLKKIVAARGAEATAPAVGDGKNSQNGHAAAIATLAPSATFTPAAATATATPAVGVRDNPFQASLVQCVRLTHLDAPKDIRHVVIDLLDSGLHYEPGDSLGVMPENCPELIEAALAGIRRDGRGDCHSRRSATTALSRLAAARGGVESVAAGHIGVPGRCGRRSGGSRRLGGIG